MQRLKLASPRAEDKWRFRADGASENKLAPARPFPVTNCASFDGLSGGKSWSLGKILLNEVRIKFSWKFGKSTNENIWNAGVAYFSLEFKDSPCNK